MSNASNTLVKTIANIISGVLLSLSLKLTKPVGEIISKENLITLARFFDAKEINNQGLQKAIEYLAQNPQAKAEDAIKELGLLQISDESTLLTVVADVVASNPGQVEQYKSGKVAILGYLVGQCMKLSKGQGNPVKFNELLAQQLKQ